MPLKGTVNEEMQVVLDRHAENPMCWCCCGTPTSGPHSHFAIGHDGRLKGAMTRAAVAGEQVDICGIKVAPESLALARDWQRFIDKAVAKADAKALKEAKKNLTRTAQQKERRVRGRATLERLAWLRQAEQVLKDAGVKGTICVTRENAQTIIDIGPDADKLLAEVEDRVNWPIEVVSRVKDARKMGKQVKLPTPDAPVRRVKAHG